MYTCKKLINTPGMEKMKLVSGEGGLDRTISWVHVSEIQEVVEWVEGGELLFITGVTIKDDKDALLKLVKSLNNKGLSGLVINVGPYIKKTPQEVIKFADSLDFPIFELPFEVKLIEITHIICREIFSYKLQEESINSFLDEIMFGDKIIDEEILKKGIGYGYNPDKNYYSLLVSLDDFREFDTVNNIDKEESVIKLKNNVIKIIDKVMEKNNRKYIYLSKDDEIYLMIAINRNITTFNFINNIAKQIKDELNIINLSVTIGVGEKACNLNQFKKAALDAKSSMEISKKLFGKNSIGDFKKLGVYKLLFSINNNDIMISLYNDVLGKLNNSDKNSYKELMTSLEVYIDENRNIGNAADRLFIHRNTMKYRINKIEQILKCDLKDDKTIFNIILCIKIGKFLGYN